MFIIDMFGWHFQLAFQNIHNVVQKPAKTPRGTKAQVKLSSLQIFHNIDVGTTFTIRRRAMIT